MYEIKTSKYRKDRKVLLDGIAVTVTLPGAGSEMRYSQIQRRATFLGKKAEVNTITLEELDQLEQLEGKMLDFFSEMFRDDTEDNSKVKAWISATPLAFIQQSFEDMKAQFDANDVKEGDETKELPATEA